MGKEWLADWGTSVLMYWRWSESLSACSGISCLRRRMTIGRKAILLCQLYTHHRSGEYYTLNIPNLLNPVNTHAKGVS